MDLVICSVTKITESVFLNHVQLCVIVQGDYQVEVRLLGYENPTQTCQECLRNDRQRRCCDSNNLATRGCSDGSRCDSYFIYCLRAFDDEDSREGGCSDRERMTSGRNWGDGSIDFTQDTVLGLDNPFYLQGLRSDYMVSALVLL